MAQDPRERLIGRRGRPGTPTSVNWSCVTDVNDTAVPTPALTIPGLVERQVAATPDKPSR
ncbi:hypothetical protein [Streptomyces sp. G45]|uniref:hypothetical protein n=1 Tax=Streptomyces sp. G45 TaxID=3406627 RepID=UPI003C1DE48D